MKFSVRIFPLLLLVLLPLIAFSQVVNFDFLNLDDGFYIYKNPYIQKGITLASIKWAFCADLCFSTDHADYWQPFTLISRMVDVSLWGLNPAGHHLTNLLFHLANIFLLYGIVLHLSKKNYWFSLWIAAGFSIHPSVVGIVAWVTARKDVLSIFFGFAAIFSYVKYCEKKSWKRYFLTHALQAFSLMSKPMFLTLPCLLLVLDYWPLERWRDFENKWRAILMLVIEKWGMFILSAASVGITLFARSNEVAQSSFTYREIPLTILKYIRDFIYPIGFSVYSPQISLCSWQSSFLATLFLVILTCIMIYGRKKTPFLLGGWLWFLVSLSPVMASAQDSRYLPIPMIGLLVLAGMSFIKLSDYLKISQTSRMIICLSFLLVWTTGAYAYARHWRNSLTLTSYNLATHPEYARAHNGFALTMLQAGRTDLAVKHFNQAIEFFPDYLLAHANLAVLLMEQGDLKESEHHFKLALKNKLAGSGVINNYGILLTKQGRSLEAIQQFQKILEKDPDFHQSRMNLGQSLIQEGREMEMINEYEKTLLRTSFNSKIHFDFGVLLDQIGQYEKAIHHFKEADKQDSHNAEILNKWGLTLAHMSQLSEALTFFKRAIQINPSYTEAYINVARMMSAKKEYNKAEEFFRKALEIQPDSLMAQEGLQELMTQERVKTS